MDIDDKHNLSDITESEYQERIRHIEQLASCPCTHCIDRCWDTDFITKCRKYLRWWYRYNGTR